MCRDTEYINKPKSTSDLKNWGLPQQESNYPLRGEIVTSEDYLWTLLELSYALEKPPHKNFHHTGIHVS